MKKLIVGTAGALVAAGLGLGIVTAANADTTTPTPTPTATATSEPGTSTPGQTRDDHGPGRGEGHGRGERGGRGFGLDTAALATKLGVDEAKLTTAIDAAREATRPTTRPTTEPTQAEREAARAAHQAAFAKALAKELGIDEAKVTTALNELRAAHEAEDAAADKVVLDQAVKDGKLTQAEADAVAKAVKAGVASVRGGGHGH